MKKYITFLVGLFLMGNLSAQDRPAYILYNKEGKAVKYAKLIKQVAETEVLLFGEIHNNPIGHWLQLELSQDMIDQKNGKVTLGAEMFERDNQLLIDEYFAGIISQKYFEDEVRLWDNYSTDYKPLLELAKEKGLKFIGTNIPRRYANTVFKQGLSKLDSLSEEAKTYIAPLPIEVDLELKNYKEMLEMMGGHGGENKNFPHAQAVKDATMAWFIQQNRQPEHLFIHYNGSFHSDNYEGINWYLHQYAPGVKIVTIAQVLQEDISRLADENKNKADFIICVPENMTRTN